MDYKTYSGKQPNNNDDVELVFKILHTMLDGFYALHFDKDDDEFRASEIKINKYLDELKTLAVGKHELNKIINDVGDELKGLNNYINASPVKKCWQDDELLLVIFFDGNCQLFYKSPSGEVHKKQFGDSVDEVEAKMMIEYKNFKKEFKTNHPYYDAKKDDNRALNKIDDIHERYLKLIKKAKEYVKTANFNAS